MMKLMMEPKKEKTRNTSDCIKLIGSVPLHVVWVGCIKEKQSEEVFSKTFVPTSVYSVTIWA